MLTFRKIPANNPIFIQTREKHRESLMLFHEYAEYLSLLSDRMNKSTSGKATSYVNYLVRLIILFEDNFPTAIHSLLSFDTLRKLEVVVTDDQFKQYNTAESNFPNAAFKCYLSFTNHYTVSLDDIGDIYTVENSIHTDDGYSISEHPVLRENQVEYRNFSNYPRSIAESLEAKKRSDWKCEADTNHQTFISQVNKEFYVEAHHLVPMAAQSQFQYTLDFADNIVCLCPNCHRKIHHAIDREKRELVGTLYERREDRLQRRGIEVEFRQLLRYYGVI
ncbi:HNH endonuclease [Sporosarcina ureae]|uniref:HNH endonuclease n=1 Tax=Sporosarcina ureae TaxID=1571 RepID=UPI0009DC5C18|nr:HNH endonuclease [Sporosarcina ureae]ARF16101.1 hypothetical protein SporoP17a_01535 [Sporosarcina ureae]